VGINPGGARSVRAGRSNTTIMEERRIYDRVGRQQTRWTVEGQRSVIRFALSSSREQKGCQTCDIVVKLVIFH
jgi:hypothetical protein